MSFEALYEEYKSLVYNLALQYVQNREDAQEISQDVFVSIHRSMKDFEGKSKLSTWIYRITINKSLDHIKARQRRKRFGILSSLFYEDSHEPRQELAHFDHPGVQMEQKEALKNIFGLINALPANQKTALILSRIEKKPPAEIAEIMELSVKAVESLVQRAKANLSKKLDAGEGKQE